MHILSQDDKSAVQFASVYLINTKVGYYTNESGEITLNLPENDSLIVASTGYESITLPTKKLIKQPVVYLKTKIIKLDNVTVKSNRQKKGNIEKIGNYWERQKYFVYPVIGTQWAIHLKNNSPQEGTLETLNFKFYKGKQTKFSKVLVKLYSFNEECGCPGQEILQEPFIEDVNPKQNFLSINILKRMINFPKNGLFVSIEILGFVSGSVYEPIRFGYKVEPMLAVSKEGGYDNWVKNPFTKSWNKFFVKNKLMFGATVIY
ncbi:hypothetical protein GCM10027442_23490 [Emticicia fontis]